MSGSREFFQIISLKTVWIHGPMSVVIVSIAAANSHLEKKTLYNKPSAINVSQAKVSCASSLVSCQSVARNYQVKICKPWFIHYLGTVVDIWSVGH